MKFKIFTTETCRFCTLAKSALDLRGHDYDEVTVTPETKAQLVAAGLRTVPQIYHYPNAAEAVHIGGFDDLMAWLNANEV